MNFNKSYATPVNDNQMFIRGPNPNLQGFNGVQTLNTQISNQISNIYPSSEISNDKEVLSHYNVIPNPSLKFNFIHKPHKLILYKNVDSSNAGEFSFNLNETLKDVVYVKMMKAVMVTDKVKFDSDNLLPGEHPLFYTLTIDELNKNYSDNLTTHKLNNSFCVLDVYDFIEKSNHNDDIYTNEWNIHRDDVHFDPPLNSLSKLTCKMFCEDKNNILDNDNNIIPFRIKLEFIVYTKDKTRNY